MLNRLFDPSRWLLLAIILCVIHRSVASPFENKTGPTDSRSRIFSPRMDYDEWTPLGRGDPLKNDPTFDYVPPVLDRVQYWLDSHTTEPSAKRDILILGVTAKKTSPKLPEHFLKFVDAPKFNRNKESIFRNDFTGSTGAEPPKLMRNNNFRNGPMDFRNQNKIQAIPASYYPSPFYNQKSKPYTVMMPPPLLQKTPNEVQNPYGNHLNDKVLFPEQFSTQTEEGPTLQDYNVPPKTFPQGQVFRSTFPHGSPTSSKSKQPVIAQIETVFTTPSVSFEKSNLVYQSTQTLAGGWVGSSRPTSSIPPVELNQITWKTPDRYEIDHHASASANHEVVVGQNANIIVDGDSIDNGQVVLGHKDASPPKNEPTDGESLKQPEPTSTKMENPQTHIVVANSPPSVDSANHRVSVVMPTNYKQPQNSTETTTATLGLSTDRNSPISTFGQTINSFSQSTNTPGHPGQGHHRENSMAFPEIPSSPESMSGDFISQASIERPAQVPKPQPFRNSISSPMMPLFMDTQTAHPPNRMKFNSFGESSSHQRPVMMHRPFRPPMSLPPHMSPPKSIMGPLAMPDQDHKHHREFMNPEFVHKKYHKTDFHHSNQFINSPAISTPTQQIVRDRDLTTMPSPIFTPTVRNDDDFRHRSPLMQLLNSEELRKSESGSATVSDQTMPSLQTTTVPSLTTDPLFSHYKQPAKPIRGPMYLIIQGHSKVKTYKPTVNKYGVPVANDIFDTTTKRVQTKYEKLINENARATIRERDIGARKRIDEGSEIHGGPKNLLSFVENGLGAFTIFPPPATEEERQANSVTTIEINGN